MCTVEKRVKKDVTRKKKKKQVAEPHIEYDYNDVKINQPHQYVCTWMQLIGGPVKGSTNPEYEPWYCLILKSISVFEV